MVRALRRDLSSRPRRGVGEAIEPFNEQMNSSVSACRLPTAAPSVPLTFALSIRQPWAWLIVHGFKDVENRTWPTDFRGPFLVHAGLGMSDAEYDDCERFVAAIYQRTAGLLPEQTVETTETGGTPVLPKPWELHRGGIVGQADLAECIIGSNSPWFTGPYGLLLRNARPLPFRQCRGNLGFFQVR